MGLYEAAKDALSVAQKADNIELVQKLLDVQKMALDVQEKQQEFQLKVTKLEDENKNLRALKKYVFAKGQKYLIDPNHPERHLCPVCTPRIKSPVPLDDEEYCYASSCKRYY